MACGCLCVYVCVCVCVPCPDAGPAGGSDRVKEDQGGSRREGDEGQL